MNDAADPLAATIAPQADGADDATSNSSPGSRRAT